jgi:hypothetical protein
MAEPRLRGRVAVATEQVAGGGKGATVYVIGRSVRGAPTALGRPGTLDDTAEELSACGGIGLAVRCDHTDDAQVEAPLARPHAAPRQCSVHEPSNFGGDRAPDGHASADLRSAALSQDDASGRGSDVRAHVDEGPAQDVVANCGEKTASAHLRTFICPRPDLITCDGDVPGDGLRT